MGKFERLNNLKIDGKTTPFELPEAHVPEFCDDVPVLHLAHMGRGNDGYFNARMTMAANGMAKKRTRSMSREQLEEEAMKEALSLERDRELIPAYVIKGWDNMYDDDGNKVDFSPAEAAELVEQLPDDIVDRLRTVAADVSNYRTGPALSPAGAEALEGNSQSG